MMASSIFFICISITYHNEFIIIFIQLEVYSILKIKALDSIIEEITYEQTASYQITEMFMNNREYMLDKLLRENEK